MLSKSTDELNHEIRNATDMEDYLKRNKGNMITSSLSEHLNLLLSQKGLKSRCCTRLIVGSGIRIPNIFWRKTPSRDKLIAIAFGLKLSDDETQKMLKISGNRELYARDKRDALILFALQHKRQYGIPMNYYSATILQSLVFRRQNNCIAAFPKIILLLQFHFYDFQKSCFSFLYTSKNFRPETDLFCELIKVPF